MLKRFLNYIILYFIQHNFIKGTVFYQNIKSNTMEDINGNINKSSSQDIISRDIGKKEFTHNHCILYQTTGFFFDFLSSTKRN